MIIWGMVKLSNLLRVYLIVELKLTAEQLDSLNDRVNSTRPSISLACLKVPYPAFIWPLQNIFSMGCLIDLEQFDIPLDC